MSAQMFMTVLYATGGAVALVYLFLRLKTRLELSLAKHRSLTGHSRMARRVASLIPFYDYDEDRFFRSDDAPADVAAQRRDGFMRLSELWRQRFGTDHRADARRPRPASPTCSSPPPIACRSSSAGSSVNIFRPDRFWRRRQA